MPTCPRCRNTLEYITHPTRHGLTASCWQCEQRHSRGLPALPLLPVVTIEALRRAIPESWLDEPRWHAERYATYVDLIPAAQRMNRAHRQKVYAKAYRERLRATGTPYEARHTMQAERTRAHWQRKAAEFALERSA